MHQKWRVVILGMQTEQMTVVGIGENWLSLVVGMYHRSSKNPS